MKKTLLILFTLTLTPTLHAQGTWTPRDTLPNDTDAMVQGLLGFSIGNYGYAGLGSNRTNMNAFWRYDPSNNSWTRMADFPGLARIWPADFVIGDKAYIVCGSVKNGGLCVNECWEYDATANSWTQKANFPGSARVYAVGFAIDSLGYVGTGAYELGDFRKDFYSYHPSTNAWTRIADLPAIARDFGFGCAINGKGYICGGKDSTAKTYSDLLEYDPVSNSWSQKANYPHPLDDANGFGICSNIYVYGDSTDGFDHYHEFWKYNTVSNTWMRETDMPGSKRYETMAFSIADTGYSGFGYDTLLIIKDIFYKFYGGDSCETIRDGTPYIAFENGIDIYPNPFSSTCTISVFNELQNISPLFTLYNMQGRKLDFKIEKYGSEYVLMRNNLKNGVYVLSIGSGSQIFYKKLIITN